jgi:hypothetical protein
MAYKDNIQKGLISFSIVCFLPNHGLDHFCSIITKLEITFFEKFISRTPTEEEKIALKAYNNNSGAILKVLPTKALFLISETFINVKTYLTPT